MADTDPEKQANPAAPAGRLRPPAVRAARALIGFGQELFYGMIFSSRACGAVPVESGRPFLVVSNHASHLDGGLIKHAMGPAGKGLGFMAARDYFFASPLSRFIFSNFSNLIPMSRGRDFAESARAAGSAFRAGRSVAIFPEGTRSMTGAIAAFKPAAGFLAMKYEVDVLPVYISGVQEALPKGAVIPRRRDLAAHFGAPLAFAELKRRTGGLPDKEAYHAATAAMEEAVRALESEHKRRCGG